MLLWVAHWGFAQFEIPPKPELQTSVYDYMDLLSVSEKNALTEKLIHYADSTSTQIVVVIIPTTKGENIAYLGAQWLAKWGIGRADEDNGILITLAKDDRLININTGYGVEHVLTDFTSRQIIEEDILPEFKTGDFYKGLDQGTDKIFQVLQGEYTAKEKPKEEKKKNFLFLLIIVLVIIFLISRNKHKNGGNMVSAGELLEAIILSNMGRRGYRSGRGSGGFGDGFGGGFDGVFGGGMGGGGGATGSW